MQMLQPQESGHPAVRTKLSTHELLPFRSCHGHPLHWRDTHPKMGLPFPHAAQIHLLEQPLKSQRQHASRAHQSL